MNYKELYEELLTEYKNLKEENRRLCVQLNGFRRFPIRIFTL